MCIIECQKLKCYTTKSGCFSVISFSIHVVMQWKKVHNSKLMGQVFYRLLINLKKVLTYNNQV